MPSTGSSCSLKPQSVFPPRLHPKETATFLNIGLFIQTRRGGGGIEILLKNNRTGRQKSRSGAKAQLEREWQRGPPHLVPYSSLMEALCHLLVQVTKEKAVVRSNCLILQEKTGIVKVYKHLSRRKVTYLGLVKDTANLCTASSF